MATILKPKKRTKPEIIEIKDNDSNEEINEQKIEDKTPLINGNDFVINCEVSDQEITRSTSPSAPPEEEYRPTGLADDTIRRQFVQKVYAVLMLQKTLFVILLVVFTFIPHSRKIFRKLIFDQIFLSSIIGYPLMIAAIVVPFFPAIRRRFAKTAFLLITTSLSFLISYVITQKTAGALLYSMGFSGLCDSGVILGSKARLDLTKWRYISLIPLTMIGSSALAPTVLHTSLNNTIWPSIAMTSLSTYLAANTVPVIRHNDVKLEPNEYFFAVTQLYLNPEQSLKHRIKRFFLGSDERKSSNTCI